MKIIHDINELVIREMENNYEKLKKDKQDISEFIVKTQEDLNKLGVRIVKEALEKLDKEFSISSERKKHWHVKDSACPNTLDTLFGRVHYTRTYYVSKEKNVKKPENKYAFLSDEQVGIKPNDKMDLSLKATLIKNAVDLPYRKSGKLATAALEISGQTVMNSIREFATNEKFIAPIKAVTRNCKTLFIEVDEDHVSLQTKGIAMPRLAYVHEGLDDARENSTRNRLKNVRYFGGIYKDIDKMWEEIQEYIYSEYDMTQVEKIYLSGDGAKYIKLGRDWFGKKCEYVFDGFHISKYIKTATRHISRGESRVWDTIKKKDKDYLEALLTTYEGEAIDEKLEKRVIKANKVILNHFEDILPQFNKDYIGCSAEGHISHIYASRLSSRPLGWSEVGVDQMAKLRVFIANGGNIMTYLLEKKKHEQDKQVMPKVVKREKTRTKYLLKKASGFEGVGNITALNRGKCDGTYAFLRLIKYKHQ